MIWTKNKPTKSGYYWVKIHYKKDGEPFSNQPPRVVKLALVDDRSEWQGQPEWDGTSLMCLESPDYNENEGLWVSEMSEEFEWSDTEIALPKTMETCGCRQLGIESCSSCDATIPLPSE